MALNKLKFNSINVTPAASEALKFNSSANGFETGSAGGAMTFISKQTASSSATIDFTSGIDSTYKEYIFHFNNIHPETDNVNFTFQADTGTNTNYNQTITSTHFQAYHKEDNSSTGLDYVSSQDQAQGNDFETFALGVGGDADQAMCGVLHVFNPSSDTFVKQFIAVTNNANRNDFSINDFNAGYFNTTTAITRFQFKMSSGNIDAGTITLYGIN